MEENLKLIEDINHKTRNWTAKVQVIEKGHPKDTIKGSPKKYQRLVLVDSKATRVQATLFAADIELFENSLSVLKKYYISNAIVRPIPGNQKIVSNEYQWIINSRTLIEEVTNDSGKKLLTEFSFVSFADLHKYVDSMSQVDVIALAINILPTRQLQTKHGECTIQEILVVNEELKPLLLTMWDQFVPNECVAIGNLIQSWPIIVGIRLKAVSFNGLSLSTKSSTSFLLNPDLPEAVSLRSWSLENEQQLRTIITENSISPGAKFAQPPKDEDIIPINNISSVSEKDTFWIEASASIPNLKQNFWYMACNKCNKAIAVEYGRVFTCIHCKREVVMAQPRCRFEVELQDDTGIIMAAIFGKNAENLFSISAMNLMEKTNEDGIIEADLLNEISSTEKHLFLLKRYQFNSQDIVQERFNIIAVQEDCLKDSTTKTL